MSETIAFINNNKYPIWDLHPELFHSPYIMLYKTLHGPWKLECCRNSDSDGSDNVSIKWIRFLLNIVPFKVFQLALNVKCKPISHQVDFLGPHPSVKRERNISRCVFTSLKEVSPCDRTVRKGTKWTKRVLHQSATQPLLVSSRNAPPQDPPMEPKQQYGFCACRRKTYSV